MDFRDIIKKMNDTGSEKKVVNESVEPVTETKLPSLKKIFEALSTQTAIPVVGKEGDKASTQAGFIHIDDTSPAGKAMSQALSNLAKDKKAQIVVPTTQKSTTGTAQPTQPQQSGLSTGGGAPSTMKEEQVDEKWAGDAKVKPTGQYKDKTKEELKSMLAKLKKSGPHGKDSPAAKKMRQINFALRAKGGWKSGEGAAMKETELNEISDETLASYIDKAKKSSADLTAQGKHKKSTDRTINVIKAQTKRIGNRMSDIKKAMAEEKVDEKAKNPYAIGMAAAKKAAGITKKHATDLPKSVVVKGHEIAKKIQKKQKVKEGDIASTKSQDTMGAGLGAGRSDKTLEAKQVNESMNPKIKAAYHEGYSHGLRGASHSGKRYEDMEEARQYHEGYKCGLDECYGMAGDPKMGDRESPIVGLVGENMPSQPAFGSFAGSRAKEMAASMAKESMPASVPAMATQAMPTMEDDMEEGNAFTAALAKTPKGGKFTVGGKTFTDRSSYDSDLDETFAFESLDKQLADLLKEDAEPVSEGLSVSMSTGNEGSPDTVSVTGTDDAAGKLLAFIKQVGLGGIADEKPEMSHGEPAVVSVSDYGGPRGDNSDMKALLQKVSADDHDHAPEAKEGDMCSECGMGYTTEGSCGCDKEAVEEVQTQDQKLYDTTSESEVKEDDGEGYEQDEADAAEIDSSMPAKGGATNEDGAEAPGSDVVGQSEEEESEDVNEESTEKMDQHAEKAAEKVKKDIEYDDKKDREHDKLDEWANNAGQKGTDTSFEQDIEFMTKVISGGLNKPKVTGQTTIPVISSQDARDGTKEDLASWMKLAGVKK